MKTSVKNSLIMWAFTILLGAFAGLVIWCFLKAVGVCTQLVWERLPEMAGNRWILLPLCGAGGLAVGVLHRRFGNYPDSLDVVMGKIKTEKYYDYHPMLVMLLCAFFPLVFGASVGPEAGLTGIIAALCYWVGDNVKYAKQNAAAFSQIGEVVTLGHLFRSPLFGILAVEENEQDDDTSFPIPKTSRLVLYALSTAASFLVIGILNSLFGKAMSGFPAFSQVAISKIDYALLLVYIPVGIVLYFFYEVCEKAAHLVSGKIPVILKEVLCGFGIGAMSLLVPMVLFSGEEQMAQLMENAGTYAPLFLIGVCLLKLIMTAFCLSFGMKGGHFFPIIFACVCMGFGLTGLIFPGSVTHAAFAGGSITAAMLGAQLKKPVAAALLLLLCFPAHILFWLFLSAAIGAGLGQLFRKGQQS